MEVESVTFGINNNDEFSSSDPKNVIVIGNNPLKKIKINLKGFKKAVQEVSSHVSPPPTLLSVYHEEAEKKAADIPNPNNSLKMKINLKGVKKVVQEVSSHVILPPIPLENLKLGATKRKLDQRYHEEVEKKAKRKIQCIDFPDSKNLSGGNKVKVYNGDVRERLLAKMKRMKKKNDKPKYTLYSTKIF